jgi:uncharacterized protein (DUF1684 family)
MTISQRSTRLAALAALSLIVTGAIAAPTPDDSYDQQIQQWRSKRVERLKQPGSWLSLVALDWLAKGDNTIGSASDNRIVLDKAPPHLGVVHWSEDGKVTLNLLPGSAAKIDGKSATQATLIDDTGEAAATEITYGTVAFHLIDRNGRKGLRVSDLDAPTRTHFLGIDYFPIDPDWRITGKWVAFDTPHEISVPTILGTIDKEKANGKVVFERDGQQLSLTPTEDSGDGSLFFVMADKTSGKDTYGGARFLVAAAAGKDGRVTLDFNEAYNPPCAFTPYATCPLAPAENRLAIAVTAGEKKYRGHE